MKNKDKGKVLVSETLLMFLVEWLEWATTDDDAEDYRFQRYAGLCASYDRWCRQKGIWFRHARQEIVGAFRASGLDKDYPFGKENYDARSLTSSQHLDPARLAWVRKVISDNRRAGRGK